MPTLLEIKYIPIKSIKPYKGNPRVIPQEAIQKVATSIHSYGFNVPLVLDSNLTIITGHTRYKAAEYLNLTEIPCIIADYLTKYQIKEFRIVDNKTNEYSQWDLIALKEELQDVNLANIQGYFDDLDLSAIESITTNGFEIMDESDERPGKKPKEITCPECGHTWEKN